MLIVSSWRSLCVFSVWCYKTWSRCRQDFDLFRELIASVSSFVEDLRVRSIQRFPRKPKWKLMLCFLHTMQQMILSNHTVLIDWVLIQLYDWTWQKWSVINLFREAIGSHINDMRRLLQWNELPPSRVIVGFGNATCVIVGSCRAPDSNSKKKGQLVLPLSAFGPQSACRSWLAAPANWIGNL